VLKTNRKKKIKITPTLAVTLFIFVVEPEKQPHQLTTRVLKGYPQDFSLTLKEHSLEISFELVSTKQQEE